MVSETIHSNHEAGKHIIDVLSMATVIGTLAEYLPAVAALFSIVWTAIRIYETNTVQRLLGRKREDD
jgi:hypothetical protein